jgi:hypothetical protein
MSILKNLLLIILSFVLFTACADAQTRNKTANKKTQNKTNKVVPKPPVEKSPNEMPNEYKVLVEGQHSKVDVPFLVVARDAETFALIRTLVDNLPASSTVDFSKTAVVAAFAGDRNTGGWTVAIRPAANKTVIELQSPPKGEMTAQVISQPYQVMLVPVSQMQTLAIEPAAHWTGRMTTYRVSKANFESTGGIAGRVRKISVTGTIRALNFGEISTYHFDLSGTGNEQEMKLWEIASGVVRSGNLELTHLNASTFGDFPHPPLKIFGTANDKKLSLTFESHPPIISDGFMLRGTLDAVIAK